MATMDNPLPFPAPTKEALLALVNAKLIDEMRGIKKSIPDKSNKSKGKIALVKTEELDYDVYKPGAKMVSCRILRENISSWVCALATRYFYKLGDNQDYEIKWENKEASDGTTKDIQIQVADITNKVKESVNLFTLHVYLTTHAMTVQGNFIRQWGSQEFEILREVAHEIGKKHLHAHVTSSAPSIMPSEDEDEEIEADAVTAPLAPPTTPPIPVFHSKAEDIENISKDIASILNAVKRIEDEQSSLHTIINKIDTNYVTKDEAISLKNRLKTVADSCKNDVDGLHTRVSTIEKRQDRLEERMKSQEKKFCEVTSRFKRLETNLEKHEQLMPTPFTTPNRFKCLEDPATSTPKSFDLPPVNVDITTVPETQSQEPKPSQTADENEQSLPKDSPVKEFTSPGRKS